jgi:putative nucleotidyltransferase with HDIG domain
VPDDRPLIELITESLEEGKLELPVFSKVAADLHHMITLDKYGLNDVAKLVETDQALASKILKAANTSFYTGLEKAKTIRDATVRLGAKSVVSLVTVATQKQLYKSRVKEFNYFMNALWRHALCVAMGSRWLSINLGFNTTAEESFLAGLLHDIGKLLLLKAVEDLLLAKKIPAGISIVLIYDIIDTFHTSLGEKLMSTMNMPEKYTEVVARHHDHDLPPENVMMNVVRLANLTSHKIGCGPKSTPDLMLTTTPEAMNLMVKDIPLAELQVELEESLIPLEKSL